LSDVDVRQLGFTFVNYPVDCVAPHFRTPEMPEFDVAGHVRIEGDASVRGVLCLGGHAGSQQKVQQERGEQLADSSHLRWCSLRKFPSSHARRHRSRGGSWKVVLPDLNQGPNHM